MLTEEQRIQNCVNWNILQRNQAKARNDVFGTRHFQRNIDRLNAQLRSVN